MRRISIAVFGIAAGGVTTAQEARRKSVSTHFGRKVAQKEYSNFKQLRAGRKPGRPGKNARPYKGEKSVRMGHQTAFFWVRLPLLGHESGLDG